MGSVGVSGALLCQSRIIPSLTILEDYSMELRNCRGMGSTVLSCTKRTRGRGGMLISAMTDDESPGPNKDQGGGQKVDWDKAWNKYQGPQKKKKSFLNIDMEQYVSRRPEHSNYPISEEIDPLRKTERSALGFWTGPNFTYVLIGVVVLLFIYMVIVVGPPPPHSQ